MFSEMLDEIIITGRSIRGASHIRAEKICQDYNKIIRTPNYAVIAVADGHGSSYCPYSDEGAKVAANVFCDLMESYCDGNFGDNLRGFISQDAELKISQKILVEWKRRILDRHEKFNREVVYDENIFKMYGTTLLGLLMTKDFIFAFQLGDGDIIFVDADNVEPVINAEKFLGVETHSLSSKNAWRHSAAVVKTMPADKNFLYILMTDGVSNSYATQEDFYKACRDYFDIFINEGGDYVNENLTDWLNEVTTQGSGDDVTAVFAYHKFFEEEATTLEGSAEKNS